MSENIIMLLNIFIIILSVIFFILLMMKYSDKGDGFALALLLIILMLTFLNSYLKNVNANLFEILVTTSKTFVYRYAFAYLLVSSVFAIKEKLFKRKSSDEQD